MAEWRLRKAIPDDASGLAALARQTFCETFTHYPAGNLAQHLHQYYTPEIFFGYINDPNIGLWLAESEGVPVAYVKFGEYKLPLKPSALPVLELHRLYVLKAWHGRRIGAALMEKLFAAARRQNTKAIYLGVWENNHSAQAFYSHYGFTKAGEYDYPPVGNTLDREWIMAKSLA